MALAMAFVKTIYGRLSDQVLANVVSSSWTNEGINYSIQPAEEFLNLLSRYFVSVFTLVNALKNGDRPNVDASTVQMYKIADDMAVYFTKVNPFWNEVQWKNLLYTYDNLIIQEAVAFLSGDFEKDLDMHDRLEYHSLILGDYIAYGILQYLTFRAKGQNRIQCVNK